MVHGDGSIEVTAIVIDGIYKSFRLGRHASAQAHSIQEYKFGTAMQTVDAHLYKC